MAYPDKLSATCGEHRMYDFANSTQLYAAMMHSAITLRSADFETKLELRCGLHSKVLRFGLYNLVRIALNMGSQGVVQFEIEDGIFKRADDGEWTASGLNHVSGPLFEALFSLHVEQWLDWVKINISTDFHQWPPVANFCRVVRNAMVHGGTINITSPNAPVVSWETLTYSHKDFGRHIMASDLAWGDLIVLAFAFNDELDGLGAPIPARP